MSKRKKKQKKNNSNVYVKVDVEIYKKMIDILNEAVYHLDRNFNTDLSDAYLEKVNDIVHKANSYRTNYI